MITGQQNISKGFYKYSKINDFISVKNYIFVRRNGKKCLVLRLLNEMEYQIDSLYFSVVQMDSNGKILDSSRIYLERMNFAPGKTYVTSKGIVVNEYCSDFKIVFSEAYSGNYIYRVNDETVSVYYMKKEPPLFVGIPPKAREWGFSVKPRRFGKPKLAVFIATVIILALFALNIYKMFWGAENHALYVDSNHSELLDDLSLESERENPSRINIGDRNA